MASGNKDWTRDEHILAFNLYCKLPFGKFHRNNPDVIALANLIHRTPSSVAMKLGNIEGEMVMFSERLYGIPFNQYG